MAATTAQNATSKSLPANINPMPLWQALLYFGLPALLFRISLYAGTPALIRFGLPPFEANVVSFTLPAVILFALAFAFYKRDGYPLSWAGIKTRFRLLPMTSTDWLWAIDGFLVTFLSIGALSFTALLLITAIPALGPPDSFPPWLKLWHVAFYPWQVFALLPICLTVPYIAQRRQNTWPAIIIHWQNGIVLLVILAMVLAIA